MDSSAVLAIGFSGERSDHAVAADAPWKAGTARAVITPKTPMWMSGYAARTKPSQGVVHDLWAKALALEDPNGRRAILITLDVCGIGRDLSNRVRDAIRIAPSARARPDRAGLLAHAFRAGRRPQPALDVQPRRRGSSTWSPSTRSSWKRRSWS